jgi:RNA polymerase-binding transcription factor DksA
MDNPTKEYPMNPTLEMSKKFRTLFETEKKKLLFSSRLVNEDFAIQADDLMDEVDFTSFELENQMKLRLRNREALYLKKF